MTLLTMLEREVGIIESDIKGIAALIWRDLKAAASEVETIVVEDVKAALPAFTAAVKDYALQIVNELEQDPIFSGARGSWKFGIASARLWAAVKAGIPGFEHLAVSFGQATVETIVQDSVKTLLVSATANPTSSQGSSRAGSSAGSSAASSKA
jgi:hypothetical protein